MLLKAPHCSSGLKLNSDAYLSSPSEEHQTFLLVVGGRYMERKIHTNIFSTYY